MAPERESRSDFRLRVLGAVRRIPAGRVATYGDVAAMAGRPRAWRAVGTIMRTCRDHGVPCHRVIGSGGRLGGYGGSEGLKRALLQAEGIVVLNGRIRRFREVRYALNLPRRRPGKLTSGGEGPARRSREKSSAGAGGLARRSREKSSAGGEGGQRR